MAKQVIPEALADKVFARRATGLIKGMSWTDSWVQNMNGLAPGAMIAAMFVVVPAWYPGADLYMGYMLMLPITLCYALSYSILAACMPRSGGDYIFGSRVVHPIWGLMGSFMYFNVHFLLLGTLPAFAVGYYLPTTIAMAFPGNVAAMAFVEWVKQPTSIILLGTIIIATGALIPIFGLKPWKTWNWIMCIVGMAGLLTAMGVLAAFTHTDFIALFNNYASQFGTSFNGIVQTATDTGWTLTPTNFPATTMAMLFVTLYITTAWPVYYGGEVKEGEKSLPKAIFTSIMIAWLVCPIATFLYYRVVTYNWASALGFLAYNNPSAYPLPFPPEMVYFTSILTGGNAFITLLVGLSVTIWTISWLYNMNVLNSRMIFAWSFDRIFPTTLSVLHPKYHSPARALIMVAIIGEIYLIAATYTNVLVFMMNAALMCCLAFMPAGFSCALLAWRRPDIWEKAPSWVKRIGKGPTTIVGLVHGGGLAFLAFMITFVYPQAGGPLNPLSVGLILGIYAACFVWYFVARAYRLRKEGIDVAWAFKQIPPA
jgi:amino acid transporter